MSLFERLSLVSRRRKMELFYCVMQPTADMRLLDVGAQADGPQGGQLIDQYPWRNRISALNLLPEHIHRIQEHYPDVDARVGDARRLPWPDKSFDIVWSNAVIEHVGSFEDQAKMAREIMRVGKRWFVTTPNRWYPFEFHLRLPLVTWLPRHGYLWCGRFVTYNYEESRYMRGPDPTVLRLLSASEMRHLFPGSRIIKQRVTFMAETLIAAGGETRD